MEVVDGISFKNLKQCANSVDTGYIVVGYSVGTFEEWRTLLDKMNWEGVNRFKVIYYRSQEVRITESD